MPKTHNILVTRKLDDDQISLAKNLGLNVSVEPAIEISLRNDWLSVNSAVQKAEKPVFVFTSQNGVRAFLRFVKAGLEIPETPLIYAVGNKTSDLLKENGYISLIPNEQNGAALAEMILDDIKSKRVPDSVSVLHFCGNLRRDELRQLLTNSDIDVKDIVVYKTVLNQMNLSDINSEGILFYSPSAVQAFRQSGGFRQKKLPKLFAIGPTTAEELSIESGGHVFVSPEPDTEIFLKFTATVLAEDENSGEGKNGPHQKGTESTSKLGQGDDS